MALKIIIIGNWELCGSIVNGLLPPKGHLGLVGYEISVLTTPSQTLSLPSHVSPEIVLHMKTDFSSVSLKDAFKGQDCVISTMSGGDSELQIRIVDAALATGVKRFIPHEFGHDTINEGIQARIPKYAGRARVLRYLRKTTETSSSFEWVAIATGYTLDKGLISGDLGFDLEWHSATVHGIGSECFAASSLERVGTTVASVLQHWGAVKNTYIYAAGTVTSANEILEAAERNTASEWTVGNYDVEDCVREGNNRIERGFPDAGMTLLERSVLYDEELNACAPFRSQSANKLLALESESVDVIVDTAYHDLKHFGKPGCGCSS